MLNIQYPDFEKVEIRVGKVISAKPFPEARKPAYQLLIDFGSEIGQKRSSAQITKNYTVDQLEGMLVLAVINFPPKQIGSFMSEVLTLGVPDDEGEVVLITPSKEAVIGGKLY